MGTDFVRPRFEVADVVRAHGEEFGRTHFVTTAQAKVLRHITACRTAALGGHVDACDACGHERISYNSCRDRHCPKCQGTERARWLERRLEHLLPVPYFHVVFTLPEDLNALVLGNKSVLYKILFRAAAHTLQQIARDERHLGAELGFTVVLHTWGQNLLFHPHVHCVVTGGGLSTDGTRWVAGRGCFLLPVKVLGRLFRGKFLAALHRAWRMGELRFGGSTSGLDDASIWQLFKNRLYSKDWVVYAKRPFGGPEHVYRYLGRYTHRIAISNHRIVAFANGKVSFSLRDYADGGKRKVMTVDAMEFLRRFLLHVLPKGFVRIRHYGLNAACNVADKLQVARTLLEPRCAPCAENEPTPCQDQPWAKSFHDQTGVDVMACPQCKTGRLIRREVVSPQQLYGTVWSAARSPPYAS